MKKKLFSAFFVPAILFLFSVGSATAEIVIAGSDFQAKTDAESGNIVSEILGKMQADSGMKSVAGVIFCGDYTVKLNNRAGESESGIAELKKTLLASGLGIKENEIILVQGNHDPVGTRGISPSGANDPKSGKYGVFVINEDDYMWMQGRSPSNGNPDVSDDEAVIKRIAKNLESYLQKKEKAGFHFPIFVVSHLPLHYSMRSFNDGDGHFSKYIFDVLNRFGARGQKIIFLFGHNHSHGWDNYIGGSAVFLSRGDKIYISTVEDVKKCTKETLAFTYMNAGYTGYFLTDDPNDGAEKTLSMTLFDISPRGDVTIKRYSQKGRCRLKAKGVPNTRKNKQESELNLYKPDVRVK